MKLKDATVLVVDDEPELREIFSAWLGRSAGRVLTAANGEEALAVLAAEKVDALVSDIRMPIVDGITLVRRIYAMGLAIPSIIFVSGFGDVDRREMHALGVEALLEKPLDRKHLLNALQQSLMEREDLWLTPAAGPMEQSVTVEMESLDDAMNTLSFQIGRGGCGFVCERVLSEEKTIDLAILFRREGLSLRAQGEVRWYAAGTTQAGVAFHYLDPGHRDWVIDSMKSTMPRCFIPQC